MGDILDFKKIINNSKEVDKNNEIIQESHQLNQRSCFLSNQQFDKLIEEEERLDKLLKKVEIYLRDKRVAPPELVEEMEELAEKYNL